VNETMVIPKMIRVRFCFELLY